MMPYRTPAQARAHDALTKKAVAVACCACWAWSDEAHWSGEELWTVVLYYARGDEVLARRALNVLQASLAQAVSNAPRR